MFSIIPISRITCYLSVGTGRKYKPAIMSLISLAFFSGRLRRAVKPLWVLESLLRYLSPLVSPDPALIVGLTTSLLWLERKQAAAYPGFSNQLLPSIQICSTLRIFQSSSTSAPKQTTISAETPSFTEMKQTSKNVLSEGTNTRESV